MWRHLEQKEVGAAMRVSGGRVSRRGEEDNAKCKALNSERTRVPGSQG